MSKPQLPTEVYVAADEVVDWKQFLIIQARHANVTHASSKLKFTPEIIEKLAIICQSEDDLEEDAPPVLWLVLEQICKLLEQSKEYQSITNMTDTTETAEEAEPLSPQAQEYVATLEAQEKEQLTKREPQEANSQELAIVQAAHAVGVTVSLEEARAQLAQVFHLGDNNQLKPKEGSLVTPALLGMAMCYGAKISSGGDWIYADSVNMLMAEEYEDAVINIASMLGRAPSTVYNWSRTADRVPANLRNDAIPISTYVEIATKRYEQDEEKNNQAIAELVKEAAAEKWSQAEARSHARHRQGKDEQITDGSGGKKVKYNWLVVLPGVGPMYALEQPAWSEGALIINLKDQTFLKDVDNKLDFYSIPRELTDAQIRELQQATQ